MRSADDLTAAATIRESATALFAERGVSAVSIRDVAADAGVSPGLVMHHYTSKAGLKRAVDERVLAMLGEMFAKASDPQLAGRSVSSMVDVFADEISTFPRLLPYLRRMLIEGGDSAERLFRALFESTRATLRTMRAAGLMSPTDDEDARAAFLLVNDLGAIILRDQVHAVLGVDPMGPDGIARWGDAVMAAYSHPVYTPPAEGA